MRSLRLPLGLLLALGLAAQVCTAAGLLQEDGGQAPRMVPVQPPQVGDLKADLQRLRKEIGKLPASSRMTLRFYSQLDDLGKRLNQLPAQPSRPERSIDPGIVRWADSSIDPGIISWADPSIDPGIARAQVAPLAAATAPTAPPAFVVPALE